MKNAIVQVFEIFLYIFTAITGILGAYFGYSIFNYAGLNGGLGAVIGLIVGLLIAAVLVGFTFLLLQIRDLLIEISAKIKC